MAHVGGAARPGDLDRNEVGPGGDPAVGPVGGVAVAGQDPGHEGAVAERVGVGVAFVGEVDAALHPPGQVADLVDSGVDEGHGHARPRPPLGPEGVGPDHLREHRAGVVHRRGVRGVRLHRQRTVGRDGPHAGIGRQGGQLRRRDAGRHTVDDRQGAHDPAAVACHGGGCRPSGDALHDDAGRRTLGRRDRPAPGRGADALPCADPRDSQSETENCSAHDGLPSAGPLLWSHSRLPLRRSSAQTYGALVTNGELRPKVFFRTKPRSGSLLAFPSPRFGAADASQ